MITIKFHDELRDKFNIRRNAAFGKGVDEYTDNVQENIIPAEEVLKEYNCFLELLRESIASKAVSIDATGFYRRIKDHICKRILMIICKDFFRALNVFQERLVSILVSNEEIITRQEREILKLKEVAEDKQLRIDALEVTVGSLAERLDGMEKMVRRTS